MSNPFERFGITHLSPSSLNTYAANPSLWVGKYLMGWRDEMGPSAHRGTAVEAGLDLWLYKRDKELAIQAAYQRFATLTDGLADEEHDSERDNLEPMLCQAIAALKDCPIPNARQMGIEYWANGIEIPIIGYIDYLFDDFGLDLKTTKACPSAIKADHGRQCALYAKAKSKPFKLLYVTAKRSNLLVLSDDDAALHLRDLERQARAVRHLLRKSETADDAAKFFAPERSDFRWSEKTLEKADQVWRVENELGTA